MEAVPCIRKKSAPVNRGFFEYPPFSITHLPMHRLIPILSLIVLSFFCVISFGHPACAQAPLPRPRGYVNDFAGLLSSQTIQHLEGLIAYIHEKTTAEVAVVTIESIEPYTIEEYAVRLFETWGIGKKGKDNGVLLLVALKEREMRIEVGYGLEGAITDGTAGEIIRQIITPAFKEGQFDRGILEGAEAILRLVAREYQVKLPEGLAFKTGPRTIPHGPSRISALFIIVIAIFILIFLFRSGLWPLLLLGFPFGGGGRSGGGSFGGGFGGFGGGLSGGGGASGRW